MKAFMKSEIAVLLDGFFEFAVYGFGRFSSDSAIFALSTAILTSFPAASCKIPTNHSLMPFRHDLATTLGMPAIFL